MAAEFRFRKQAEQWFKHIAENDPFRTKFDRYYLCLLLGLAGRRESNPSESDEAPGFVDYFIEDYEQQQLLIVGLLLRAELEHFGIELDDRDDVRKKLEQLIGSKGLTRHGVARLNAYASGGFDLLVERYGEAQPRSVEEFLPRYVEVLHEVAAGERLWATN